MDVIDINCKFYKWNKESECTNLLRKQEQTFLGFFKTGKTFIPVCPEVSCKTCNYKIANPVKEEKVEVKKEKKVSKKKAN